MEAFRLRPIDGGRPFLKWAGGKRQLLPVLLESAPPDFNRYFEPLVGGGALFFHLRPASAVLADKNERLIRTYRGVRDNVDDVIELLGGYRYDPRFYYEFRKVDIDRRSDAEVAAWFIYLNRAGFNGLYRVNRDNQFNVSFGRYTNPTICDHDTLRDCSASLQRADLTVADFGQVAKAARRGDLVYFDPPYVPLSATSCFTSYTTNGFDADDHRRLRDTALMLKKRGAHILLSNSVAPVVKALYRGFKQREVLATRAINSKADRRGAIRELLIT